MHDSQNIRTGVRGCVHACGITAEGQELGTRVKAVVTRVMPTQGSALGFDGGQLVAWTLWDPAVWGAQ